jgi:dTDP-3-amino-3,4,6-trideoxy-alpha-D-glucose transaminase
MDVAFFDLSRRDREMGPAFHRALDGVLATHQFVGGPVVQRFEEAFANYIGSSHCVATGNGLDALRLILQALGVGPGDEVLVPAQTFAATWLAVMQLGAIPVAVDVNPAGVMNPEQIPGLLSEKTRAVVPVHLYGQPCDIDSIFAQLKGLPIHIVEDAAQAHGAKYKGKMVGNLGAAAAFSFYPTKNLGALGDAGAITTNDEELAVLLRSLRSYGTGQGKYDHVRSGWNSRMDPIQAAVLLSQLPRLDAWNSRRKDIAGIYDRAVEGNSGGTVSRLPSMLGLDTTCAHHLYVVQSSNRPRFRLAMSESGIQTDVHYPTAAYRLPVVVSHLAGPVSQRPMPRAEMLAATCVSLPLHPWLTDDEVSAVATALASHNDSTSSQLSD